MRDMLKRRVLQDILLRRAAEICKVQNCGAQIPPVYRADVSVCRYSVSLYFNCAAVDLPVMFASQLECDSSCPGGIELYRFPISAQATAMHSGPSLRALLTKEETACQASKPLAGSVNNS
jgi:hypothetical protein